MWHITWCCRASNGRVLALGLNERRSERLPPFFESMGKFVQYWCYLEPRLCDARSCDVFFRGGARRPRGTCADVFLTAVAALLSAFSMRLGRVADHVDRLVEMLETADTGRAKTL